MIIGLKVERLNNRIDAKLEFNEDLNIITGKNGAGKTTLLKLLWYLISGNLERIIFEIPFKSISVRASSFSLSIDQLESSKGKLVCESSKIKDTTIDFEIPLRNENVDRIYELDRRIARAMDSSLFFPTFRRIEGGFAGFSIPNTDLERHHSSRSMWRSMASEMEELQEAISQLSESVSVYDHKFIASISTLDIVELLRRKYTEISDETDKLHVQLSKGITRKISDTRGREPANSVLDDIQERVEQVTQKREALFRPFSVLTDRIHGFLQYKGIRVTQGITLGEAEEAIASDKLSAGEKQMLSFLCYNTFSENAAIFIDEPELSLNVDWQRLLLPTLLEQGTGNQFFIATHSPFIYSKYPDKEILLGDDRGDN